MKRLFRPVSVWRAVEVLPEVLRAAVPRYAVAGGSIALATLLRLLLMPLFGEESPFLLALGAVVVSALYGGLGPGLLASVSSALISAYFFVPPYYSFEIADPNTRARLAACLLEAFFISAISSALRAALQRAEQRRQTAEALASVVALISQSLESRDVQQRIVDSVHALFGARRTALYISEPESGDLVAQTVSPAANPISVLDRFPRGMGLVDLAVRVRRPVATSDVLTDARIALAEQMKAQIIRAGHGAVLAVPIVERGAVIGVLTVADHRGRRFTEEEISLAESFASHAAIALANARLYRAQGVRATRLRTLAKLNQTISSSLDVDQVLLQIARAAAELMGAPAVECWVANHAVQRMELRASSDPELRADKRLTELPFGQGGVGWVANQRQPLLIPDVFVDERIQAPEWFSAHRLRSALCLPIMSGEGLLGVLSILGRGPVTVDSDDTDLLDSFVAQAAVAIDNARLHQGLVAAHTQLEQSQTRIVQAERLRALGEMAAGVAHDFNNLLAIIVGRAELLLRRDRDESDRRGLKAIHQAGMDGAQTVRRILEFTGTRRTQNFVAVDLRQVLRDVVEFGRPRWRDEAQSRSIRYDVRLEDADIPLVAGRPEELREVFLNLLGNALDAMPEGGSCAFTLAASQEEVIVEVRDTGLGMSEETRQRVFEPFFTTKGPQSSGLGLAVSWGVIARHGGTIGVESSPRTGTTMTVRLPIDRDVAVQTEPPRLPRTSTGARVLVIEDEVLVREALVDILQDAGYRVIEASNGLEGLARCETESVDLVLSDVSMPGLSGWEVAEACRARFPHVPVGLVTGWGDHLVARNAQRHGVRFIVAKPFRADDVLEQVAAALT